jgi:acetyl-CoA/propionyl-CoA carboxylase biotin carboxyl carrier protein
MTDELSPSEVARRIGATTRSVQRWIASGQLPARRVGGRWRVASDALDAFIRPIRTRPTGELATSRAVSGGATIGTLFIANRAEIARRIARTAERLGIRVVVPRSEGPGALDLLDAEAVVAGARAAGADALHPGYGFLAESADFAEAVIAAGIRWVGPPPGAIRTMGDKAAARRLAARTGVPVVPGYDAPGQSDRALVAAARRVGYPLLVKPAGGGGGKGMRVARTRDHLRDALAGARREAMTVFGDDRLVLERLVEGARHVEVQVLFDRHGGGIHLGERDCSTQRRHQKIIEETPSPGLTPAVRDRLAEGALALARAVGYESAGTCEFLVTDRGETFFLEMNTRLQVEHPVTELVTGLDLVELQLRIAAGERLPLDQAEADRRRAVGGHSIEVRLYAEDAEAGFLPATGRVEALAWPNGQGIRVDAGMDLGDEVTGRFDPMLAKIIGHGTDRLEAVERLTAALDRTVILGLVTNLRFLRWLLRAPAVRDGQMRIDTLERIWPPEDWPERVAIPESVWRAAAQALSGGGWADGWRVNAPRRLRLVADDDPASERAVMLAGTGAGGADAASARSVGVGGTIHLDVDGRSVAIRVAPPPDVDRAARAAAAHHAGGSAEIVAPMPGAIVAVHHGPGDAVEAGDPIVTLEAMKMEHVVAASVGGIVGSLDARPGDQVSRGQLLATIAPSR